MASFPRVAWGLLIFTTFVGFPSNDAKVRTLGNWGMLDETIRNMGYSYVEVDLNDPVGTELVKYPVKFVKTATFVVSNCTPEDIITQFVNVSLIVEDDQQYVQISIMKNLREFRMQRRTANVEISYQLKCVDECPDLEQYSCQTFTFLLIFKDSNYFPPVFQDDEGAKVIHLPAIVSNPLAEIAVTDMDMNINHASLNITCEENCNDFVIEVKGPADNKEYGYKYVVQIFFSAISTMKDGKGLNNGSTLSLTLLANDSKFTINHTVVFNATILVSNNEEYRFFPGFVLIISIGSSLALLLGIGFSYTTWRNWKTKKILRKLTEAEIREFLDGTTGLTTHIPKRSVDCNTPILSKPYNRAFEIPRDKLRIDETTILGSGFFGVVMKGECINDNGDSTTVAVKAVRRNVGVLYFKALLSELKIMAFIGQHSNIVSLIGACTHNIRKREVYVAVEYCANGNLNNFLRTHRTGFVNMVKDGKLFGFRSETHLHNRKGSSDKPLSTLDLMRWATQIASALEYLGSLGIIHGDLALRNVLLDRDQVAKVADFGLSRRLIDISNYYYTKQSQAPLPWKWMAIESLRDMKFSKKSDIWSFGVLLWELFTLGQVPYPGLSWNETFPDRLEKGLKLSLPLYASIDIYETILDCMTIDPHDRPDIFDIRRGLEGMTSLLLKQTNVDDGYFRIADDCSVCQLPVTIEDTVKEFLSRDYNYKGQANC